MFNETTDKLRVASTRDTAIDTDIVTVFTDSTLGTLTTVIDNSGRLWFNLPDVCRALGIANPSQAAAQLDSSERAMFYIGRQGSTNFVSEGGFYRLVFRSNKPTAREFTGWVAGTVIPSIRTAGRYEAPLVKHLGADGSKLLERLTQAEGELTFIDLFHDALTIDPNIKLQDVIDLFRRAKYIFVNDLRPTALGIKMGFVKPVTAFRKARCGESLCKAYAHVTAKGKAWALRKIAESIKQPLLEG